MKGIKITVMMLLISQAIVAQTKTAAEIADEKVKKIESVVQLSVDQKAAISDIALSSATQMLEHKNAGTLDKDARHKLRVAEHKQINSLLTVDQQKAIKASRKHTAEEHAGKKEQQKVSAAENKARKNELSLKRASFETKLTDAEKATIEKARNMMPAKVKGKEAKDALTDEQKAEAKAQRKEAYTLLQPIVAKHKAELDAIQAEIPAKPSKKEGKKDSKKGNKFAAKFLLMK